MSAGRGRAGGVVSLGSHVASAARVLRTLARCHVLLAPGGASAGREGAPFAMASRATSRASRAGDVIGCDPEGPGRSASRWRLPAKRGWVGRRRARELEHELHERSSHVQSILRRAVQRDRADPKPIPTRGQGAANVPARVQEGRAGRRVTTARSRAGDAAAESARALSAPRGGLSAPASRRLSRSARRPSPLNRLVPRTAVSWSSRFMASMVSRSHARGPSGASGGTRKC